MAYTINREVRTRSLIGWGLGFLLVLGALWLAAAKHGRGKIPRAGQDGGPIPANGAIAPLPAPPASRP